MALGATSGSIQTLMFRQGFLSVAIGLGAGLLLTRAVMRALGGVTAGLGAADTATIWITTCLVSATAVIAYWIPAYRATRSDPMRAVGQD